MEVHAHTHTPRKKWTHYFWEFLMLFLAVFCGFLAENQREHMVEHRREKDYMQNLYHDLERDSATMAREKRRRREVAQILDSLIMELDSAGNIKNTAIVYRHASSLLGIMELAYSNATIEQLKSSGSLRLIRKKGVVDSIISYDMQIMRYKERENAEEEIRHEYRKTIAYLLDARTLIKMEDTTKSYLGFKLPTANVPLLTTKPEILSLVKGLAAQLHSRQENALIYLKQLSGKCSRLLELLKKEYHLE